MWVQICGNIQYCFQAMRIDNKKIIAAGYPEDEHADRDIRPTFNWILINICNYKCSYCSAGFGCDSTRPRSNFFRDANIFDGWKSVISKLKLVRKCDWNVSLLGGEPTLHPELKHIITSLSTIKNCAEICLITNMHKSLDYFLDIYDDVIDDKCWVNPSIHFQYDQSTTVDKIVELRKTSLKVEPTIMLSDVKSHWDQMQRFLEQCIDKNIVYNSTLLEPAHGYTPSYNEDFFKRFTKYIQHGRDVGDDMYSVVTEDGVRRDVNVEDIYKCKIKHFKGWECTPKSWQIKEDGSIVNSCTKKPLSLGGVNIACKEMCPRSVCDCNEWWMYDKKIS